MSSLVAHYLAFMGLVFVAYCYLAQLTPFVRASKDGFRASWREPAHVFAFVAAPVLMPLMMISGAIDVLRGEEE